MSGTIVAELTLPFSCADVAILDIHALRAALAMLMDQAVEAIHAAGLEQDDCLLERFADVRAPPDGPIHTVEVDMLSDPERCIARILEQIGRGAKGSGPPSPAGDREGASRGLPPLASDARPSIAMVALRVRVLRGEFLDPFGFSRTGPGAHR
jgi:hypothetical protein